MGVNAVINAVGADVMADIASDRPPFDARSSKSSKRFVALKDTAAWRAAVEDLVCREATAALRRLRKA